jgi:hypothetical protein
MAKTAQELADLVAELSLKDKQRAAEMLRAKCLDAVEDMLKNREYDCTVDMSDKETLGLEEVTAELRELGYKFRFIERQKANGENVSYHLLISIQHYK